ncbi:MAG: helix-turn-helix domain-containing protein [Desulfovibrio sp.]|nr:helix-turn-helix domain-containing protein [Desulfovibrio sp.]
MAYAKGFIRSYASFLGLDKEQIRKALEGDDEERKDAKKSSRKTPKAPRTQAERQDNPETFARPEIQKESKPESSAGMTSASGGDEIFMPSPKKSSGGKGLVFFLILCLLAGGAYYAYSRGYFDQWLRESAPEPDISTKLPRADAYLAGKDSSPQEEKSAAPEYKPEVAPTPIQETPPAAPIKELLEQKSEPRDAAMTEERSIPASDSTVSRPPDPAEPHNLIITAVEECWVHSNADKTDTRQFSLRKGDTFALSFSKSLELKLGNAGGVRLRYDGADLPPPGSSGQVKTIVFPPKDES